MSSALPNFEQALAVVNAYAGDLAKSLRREREDVELSHALGRVLAQPLLADQDQPPFARSTRDGFACRAVEAARHKPLLLAGSTRAGEAAAGSLPRGAVWEIMTGAAIPIGADAVMMLEHVENRSDHIRLLPTRKIKAGENVVVQGAQAKRGDVLLPAGSRIGAAQIALAAACGYAKIGVFKRPRVAILTTGDELVPIASTPGPGQIRNSNASMLAALVSSHGGDPWVLPSAADNEESLSAALLQASDADLLLISGGVSAGKFDLVEPALARFGADFHFTGVRIQPGKPLVFGELLSHAKAVSRRKDRRKRPFYGLPGNPISSAVTFLLFVAPVLAQLTGSVEGGSRFVLAQLRQDTDRKGKPGLTRFLPAHCDFSPAMSQLPQVATVPWHGSGDLAAFARSNCFVVVPEEAGLLEAGSTVRILLP